MKANEAPEKIYLNKNNKTLSDILSVKDIERIEYTRTDAFIEKAISWLKEQKEMVGISLQEDFLERFKNYMKGE